VGVNVLGGVLVTVGVLVRVKVGVLVGVRVAVAVGVLLGVLLAVGVRVRVLVLVGVAVTVGVGVAAGVCQMPKWKEGLPPAVLKAPPTSRVVPITASVFTKLSTPLPRADQALPFQAATRLAATPPAVVNWPPM